MVFAPPSYLHTICNLASGSMDLDSKPVWSYPFLPFFIIYNRDNIIRTAFSPNSSSKINQLLLVSNLTYPGHLEVFRNKCHEGQCTKEKKIPRGDRKLITSGNQPRVDKAERDLQTFRLACASTIDFLKVQFRTHK